MTDDPLILIDTPSESILDVGLFILLNIPINYHPMNLLPSIASPVTPNVADIFTKSLPTHRRLVSFIGADPTIDTLALAAPKTSAPVATATVAASTLVASTVDPLAAVVDPTSDLVPELHPNPLPIVLDTCASYSLTPFDSDFLPVAQASYGLFRSPTSVVSVNSVVSKTLASTPVDQHTLITGEDAVAVDLSSLDLFDLNSDSVETASSFTKVYFDIRQFGTSTLTFIYSKSTLELLHIFVEPTQIDWLHWVPLPRLILPESYFHIFGLDYPQAFALFHLIPIWIYCLLHFTVNLE